jgi:hypothetical protein
VIVRKKKMSKVCASFCNGFCGFDFDPDDLDEQGWARDQPSSADDAGLCLDDGEAGGGCDEYWEDDETGNCDECGCELGFCASDCPTREADYEENE